MLPAVKRVSSATVATIVRITSYVYAYIYIYMYTHVYHSQIIATTVQVGVSFLHGMQCFAVTPTASVAQTIPWALYSLSRLLPTQGLLCSSILGLLRFFGKGLQYTTQKGTA